MGSAEVYSNFEIGKSVGIKDTLGIGGKANVYGTLGVGDAAGLLSSLTAFFILRLNLC